MVREITKFKKYLLFLSLEEWSWQKLYEVDKIIMNLLIDKHPHKNVKHKYRILEELRLIKSQLLAK